MILKLVVSTAGYVNRIIEKMEKYFLLEINCNYDSAQKLLNSPLIPLLDALLMKLYGLCLLA